MNIRRMLLSLAVLGLGLAPFSFGQLASPARPSSQRVLGYFDPATGIFQPLLHTVAEPDTTTATTETGELIVKYTITVKSTIPKNGVIGCSAIASVSDAAGGHTERATGVATLVSGTTYTCSAIINYSWLLDTPTTDTVGIAGAVTLDYGYEATATNGTATVVELVESRGSVPPDSSLKAVPPNGTTTTIDVSVTL
jgi:hypothetical protein